MTDKKPTSHPDGSRQPGQGKRVSLAPLTPDQALAAALRVDPAEVKKREKAEKDKKKGERQRKKK